MNRIASLLLAVICITGLFSCQKEYAIPGLTLQTGDTTIIIDTSVTPPVTPPTSSQSYQPFTKDSYWKYKDSASGAITTQTATAITKEINGSRYTAAVSLNPITHNLDSTFYFNDRINYYLYESVSASGASGYLIFNYLNDTATIGRTTEYVSGQANGFETSTQVTLVEKNISLTVNNVVYTQVAHTALTLSYNLLGLITPIATYDVYVAKGVGIIKLRTTGIGLNTGQNICSNLVEYSIK